MNSNLENNDNFSSLVIYIYTCEISCNIPPTTILQVTNTSDQPLFFIQELIALKIRNFCFNSYEEEKPSYTSVIRPSWAS